MLTNFGKRIQLKELIKKLGEGAYNEVFLGKALREIVVVKVPKY